MLWVWDSADELGRGFRLQNHICVERRQGTSLEFTIKDAGVLTLYIVYALAQCDAHARMLQLVSDLLTIRAAQEELAALYASQQPSWTDATHQTRPEAPVSPFGIGTLRAVGPPGTRASPLLAPVNAFPDIW